MMSEGITTGRFVNGLYQRRKSLPKEHRRQRAVPRAPAAERDLCSRPVFVGATYADCAGARQTGRLRPSGQGDYLGKFRRRRVINEADL